MPALIIELRRSPMMLATPLLVFLGALATWRELLHSAPIWDVLGTALLGMVQLMGPIAAGIAAWAAGRDRRRRLRYLNVLSVRSPAAIPLTHLLSLVIWASAAFALLAVVFVVRAAAAGTYGTFSIGPPVAGAAGLAVHVVVGYAVGRLLPWAVTPPLTVLLSYGYVVLNLDHGGQPGYLLSPVTVEQADAFHTWQAGLFVRQVLWYLLLMGCVVLLLAAALLRTRLVAAGLIVSLVAAALAARSVWAYHGHFFARQPRAFSYTCVTGSVRVCVHPAFAPALPQLKTTFSAMAGRLGGTPVVLSTFEQHPRGEPATHDATQPIYLDDLRPGYAQLAAGEFAEGLLDPATCQYGAGNPGGVLRSEAVAAWVSTGLLDGSQLPLPEQQRTLHALQQMADDGRRRWIAAHFVAFRSCTLRDADLVA